MEAVIATGIFTSDDIVFFVFCSLKKKIVMLNIMPNVSILLCTLSSYRVKFKQQKSHQSLIFAKIYVVSGNYQWALAF